MKNRYKPTYILVIIIISISCIYNFYQYKKIENNKRILKNIVSKNIHQFAGISNNISDEDIYAEKYASIVTAQEAYIALNNKGIPSEEWDNSLPYLFINIKRTMINDKDKFKEAFKETEASRLMFKISDDFEDKESISKLQALLNNY
ncbi:hypothetical protein [Clostridium sp. UBA1652]|uniref:hypothetical protein n=1 Tax=Clostridium sp. UBA1652 TaxID=1946348 RepID=UPI002580A37B|nr:hypothetical protein [Clostridium sp. UBA1652]